MKKIKSKAITKISPQLMIMLSFLAVIVIGLLCLLLPFATKDGNGLSFLDSLFLAVSATCVTGLSTISVGSELTVFGKTILALMIEIGGLSFLTIASFLMSVFGVKFGVNDRYLLKESLNQDSVKGIVVLLKRIMLISFSIQFAGMISFLFIFLFKYNLPFFNALEYSVFHAISAFNNAGFDIFTNGEGSLIYYSGDWMFNIVVMLLIILGSLGFIVIVDIFNAKRWKKLSLHSKVVLVTNGILLLVGVVGYKLFFYFDKTTNITWLEAMFQSVTMRTAGFASFDHSAFENNVPAYVLTLILMFIGASPCSTGGGFKTTTFAVLIISVVTFLKGEPPHAFKRRISSSVENKAFVLFGVEIIYIILAVLGVSICEMIVDSSITGTQVLFEVVSAFATVGVSEGITASLSVGSKVIIIVTMFIGRIGPLTMLSLWHSKASAIAEQEIKLVEGHIIVS